MVETISTNFTYTSSDGTEVYVYKWIPKQKEIRGVVQISHGMAETAVRYERFAKVLNQNGFIVYANDHRGHGKTAKDIDSLGYLGDNDGFNLLIQDVAKLSDIIREENPGLGLYLFSHSMGSFAAQRYIMDYKDKIDGLVLSGSNGEQGFTLTAAKTIAKLEMMIRGRRAKSKLMNNLSFGAYNKKFKPEKTGSEWLSRDEEEVKKYIEDPYCGTIFPTSFYYDFLGSLQYIEDESNFKKIPKDLPILIISGEEDPVGDFGKGLKKLYTRYKEAGVKDLEIKLYPGARHEILNEINREVVMDDVVNWLNNRK